METHGTLKTDSENGSPESSPDSSNSQSPLLPREAWQSKAAFLKFLLRAKRALDDYESSIRQSEKNYKLLDIESAKIETFG
jgi:hypothetical protein